MDIKQAITELLVVELTYDGGMRLVEPHVLFTDQAGVTLVRVRQVDGFTHTGNLPGWRSFQISGITEMSVLRTHFSPSPDRDSMLQGLDGALIIAQAE